MIQYFLELIGIGVLGSKCSFYIPHHLLSDLHILYNRPKSIVGDASRFRPLRSIFIFLIRLYQQLLSPLFPASCRYTPTCSEYMAQAVAKYGVFKGGWMGTKRIGRCHPFHKGGFDPVP